MDPSVTRAWITIFDVTFIEAPSNGACSQSFGQFHVEQWRGGPISLTAFHRKLLDTLDHTGSRHIKPPPSNL